MSKDTIEANKKIAEGNRRIVQFMDGEIDMGHTAVVDSYTDKNGKAVFNHIEGKAYLDFNAQANRYDKICMVANLKYHTSWDWLMPVVEKIESLDFQADIYWNHCD